MKKINFNAIDSFLYKYDFTPKKLVGINFSHTNIEICEVAKENTLEPIIKCIDFIPIEKGKQPETDPEWFITMLGELFKRNKISNKNVAITLPKSVAIIKTLEVAKMNTEDIVDSFEYNQFWENLVQLEKPINEYFIFYHILDSKEESTKMEINFTAVEKERLQVYTDICDILGFSVLNIGIETYNERNLISYVRKDENKKDYYGILKLSEEENYFSIVHEDKVSTFDIFISDNEIVELRGKEKPSIKSLNRILDRVSLQTRQLINEYENKRSHSTNLLELSDIYLISPYEHSVYYSKMMNEKNTSLDIILTNPYKNFFAEEKFYERINLHNSSYFTSLIGSSLNKFKYFYFDRDKQYKFFNLLENKGKYIKRFKRNFLIDFSLTNILILTLILSGTFYSFSMKENTSLHNEVNTYSNVPVELDLMKNKIKLLETQNEKIIKQIETKDTLLNNNKKVFETINIINLAIDSEIWFSDIKITVDTIILKGKSLSDTSVLNFVNNLKNQTQFIKEVHLDKISAVNESEKLVQYGINNLKEFDLRLDLTK